METEYNSEKNPERKYIPRKPGRLRKAVIGTAAGLTFLVGGAYVAKNILYDRILGRMMAENVSEGIISVMDDLSSLSGSNYKKKVIDPIKGYDLSNLRPEWSLWGEPKKGGLKYGVGNREIIPNESTYDLDSQSFPLESDIDKFVSQTSGDHENINSISFSKSSLTTKEEVDIYWQHIDPTKRRLVPLNGAELANLGKVDFEKVSIEDITAAHYSQEAIIGDDNNNQMTPGTVIGIKTSRGEYAKMLIEGYLPLSKVEKEDKIKNYHIRCKLGIYFVPTTVWFR